MSGVAEPNPAVIPLDEHSNDGGVKAKRVKTYLWNEITGSYERQGITEKPLAVLLDNTSDPILYIGKAQVGSDEADAVWQIAKLDTSSGLVKTWAGTAGFDQVWSNRASLTYN